MENFILKLRSMKHAILGLALLTGVFLGFKPDNSDNEYREISGNIDGTVLFKAVYFGDQTVGKFIPELNAGKKIDYNVNNKKIINKLIVEISKSDARFFLAFKNDMESGNPLLVDKAIKRGEILISKMNGKRSGSANLAAAGNRDVIVDSTYQDPNPLPFLFLNATILGTFVGSGGFSQSGLEREKMIGYITERLRK